MKRIALSTAFWITLLGPALADPRLPDCNTVQTFTCNQRGDVTLPSGYTIKDACLEARVMYSCVDPTPSTTCGAVKASANCRETARTCVSTNYGQCDVEEVTFLCTNEQGDMAPATLVKTQYKNYNRNAVTGCEPYRDNPSCVLESDTCIGGNTTTLVNGNPVTRPCWQWSQTYQCDTGQSTSDCGAYESDAACFKADSFCLAQDAQGNCIQEEIDYTCGTTGQTDPSCQATAICRDGQCEGIQEPPNMDYAEAAAWLTWLDDQADDSTKDPLRGPIDVFSGVGRTCRHARPFLDCCANNGIFVGTLTECKQSEITLIDAVIANTAHKVGSYCSKKTIFGCVQTKRSYCHFNSLLAKVFQVEARKQLGTGWGSSKTPDCRGLTYAEFGALDFAQMDLSDAFQGMIDKTTSPEEAAHQAALQQDLLTKMAQLGALYGK